MSQHWARWMRVLALVAFCLVYPILFLALVGAAEPLRHTLAVAALPSAAGLLGLVAVELRA